MTVTIAISGVDSGYIQETLHDDFTFVSSANTHDLSEDGRTLTISFQNRASVSYVVRAPEQARAYTFPGGRLKDVAGTVDVPVTGASRIQVGKTPSTGGGGGGGGGTTPPANRAPVFSEGSSASRSVAENTAAGENIGAPVAATDADAGGTLTYTLGGVDAASFDIDGATGQLKTKAALDYEDPADADTDNAYEATVTASDGTDRATVTVTITVTDIPEGSELSPYDTDNSGKIEGSEVIQAVKDYFADDITGPEVIEVVKLYFAGRSN